jgi:hypothetical protein
MATQRPKPRINQLAVASLASAAIGLVVWQILGGWAALVAATVALVLGFLALTRISRSGERGRWAAMAGIGFGALFYAVVIVVIVWDMVSPITLPE